MNPENELQMHIMSELSSKQAFAEKVRVRGVVRRAGNVRRLAVFPRCIGVGILRRYSRLRALRATASRRTPPAYSELFK